MADEFELIHKNHMQEPMVSRDRGRRSPVRVPFSGKGSQGTANGDVCNYCHELGHWKLECPLLRGWKQLAGNGQMRPAAMAASSFVPQVEMKSDAGHVRMDAGLETFLPFVKDGCVRLAGGDKDVHIRTLRDTAAHDSYIQESVLPFSNRTDTGDKIHMRGMGMTVLPVPVHTMYLDC